MTIVLASAPAALVVIAFVIAFLLHPVPPRPGHHQVRILR